MRLSRFLLAAACAIAPIAAASAQSPAPAAAASFDRLINASVVTADGHIGEVRRLVRGEDGGLSWIWAAFEDRGGTSWIVRAPAALADYDETANTLRLERSYAEMVRVARADPELRVASATSDAVVDVAPSFLNGRIVVDERGRGIGRIENVSFNADGAVEALDVRAAADASDGGIWTLGAPDARYLPVAGVVVASPEAARAGS